MTRSFVGALALPFLAAAPLAEAQAPPRPAARLLQGLVKRPLQTPFAPPLQHPWTRMALRPRERPGAVPGRPMVQPPRAPLRRPLSTGPAAGGPQVRIEVKSSLRTLRSCGNCTITTDLKRGSQSLWRWTVEEPGGGTLRLGESGQIIYTAPLVSGKRVFHVRASSSLDDSFFGRAAIEVLPSAVLAVLEPVRRAGGVPALELVAGIPAGKPEEDVWASAARFARPEGIAFMPQTGQWLVTYPGNWAFAGPFAEGTAGGWFSGPLQDTGTASDHRNPGAQLSCPNRLATSSGRGPAWRCVFAETDLDRIGMVDARGVVTAMAGEAGSHQLGPDEKHRDGRQEEARFWRPEGVAMDRAGTVYVADVGNGALRRIQDGTVTTLQSLPHHSARTRWGHHGEGPLLELGGPLNGGLALDEAGGILYLGVGHSVLGIPLNGEGEVKTLLGDRRKPGFEDWRQDPPPSLAGVPCLFWPNNLTFFRGRLYIADHGNHAVRVFDPATGQLQTMAGDPGEPVTRVGPLRCGSPHLDPGHAAALAYPAGIAFNDEGTCLVAARGGVVALVGLDPAPADPGAGAKRNPLLWAVAKPIM